VTQERQATVFLKGGGDKLLRAGHPWIFAGAVTKVSGAPLPGQAVRVADREGRFLSWGWYSPGSNIRVRLIDFDQEALIDDAWLAARLEAAAARRRRIADDPGTTAFRLVNAEADGLPGLIIDRYDKVIVVQIASAGAELGRRPVTDWLQARFQPTSIYERSDIQLRRLEGLPSVRRALFGPEPFEPVRIEENDQVFLVDVIGGAGTGFYLDQRPNRRLIAGHAAGGRVLDCFCYSGAFSVCALSAGAVRSVLVDSSKKALQEARQNLVQAGQAERADLVQGDVFKVMRQYIEMGRRFDLIILDPPDLAPIRVDAQKALRASHELNRLALRLLPSGGLLAAFSRSVALETAHLQEVVGQAASAAGRSIQVLGRLGPGEDHPALLGLPESEPLKGILYRLV